MIEFGPLPLNDLFNDLAKIKRMFQVTWNQINQNSRLWNLFFLHKNARPILRFYNKTHVFYKKSFEEKIKYLTFNKSENGKIYEVFQTRIYFLSFHTRI